MTVPRKCIVRNALPLLLAPAGLLRIAPAIASPGDMLRAQGFDPNVISDPTRYRSEPLTGAKFFIGTWALFADEGPSGQLSFLRNGDVELRSGDGALLAAGAQTWSYVSPKTPDTIVRLSFALDCGPGAYDYSVGSRKGGVLLQKGGVFTYEGKLDSAADIGARVIEGSFAVGEGSGPSARTRGGPFRCHVCVSPQ